MGKALAVGAGVAAAGAAAYMLLGPKGKQNRAKVAAFAKKTKNAVMKNKDVKGAVTAMKKAAGVAKTKVKATVKKAKAGVTKSVNVAKASVKKVVKKAVKKAK